MMIERRHALDGIRSRFTEQDVEKRKNFVGLGAEDGPRLASIRDLVIRDADKLTALFFNCLEQIAEAKGLFRRREALEEAKHLKREHLIAMVSGDYGEDYVTQRIKLAVIYSETGIDTPIFLGAFYQLMRAIGAAIMESSDRNISERFECYVSVEKVGFFDIGIIIDVMIDERERVISAQQDAIRELSTPVLQLRDRLLVLPIIGVIDSQRAKQLTDSLLHAVRANRAKVAVMDITGVAAVDSKVANHLLQTVAAARLMGASVIVTGLSADVAQSLVALGVDLSKIRTVGDLQGGIEEAENLLGYRVGPIGGAMTPPALR
jgi:rsbT co-antagonist protein RsbR